MKTASKAEGSARGSSDKDPWRETLARKKIPGRSSSQQDVIWDKEELRLELIALSM